MGVWPRAVLLSDSQADDGTGVIILPRDNTPFLETIRLALSDRQAMFHQSASAPRAGADLRAARERLNWALADVSSHLRIREPHLRALEAGRLDLLPGNSYALGYLRAYATALGLEPEEMVRRFKTEAAEVTKSTELVFPTPVPERGLPAGAFILLGLILVSAAYTGWYRLSGEGRLPAETVTPVPARLAALTQQALPGPDGRVEIPAPPPLAREQAPPSQAEGDDTFEPRLAAAENPLLRPAPPPRMQEALPAPAGTPTTAIAMPIFQPVVASNPTPGSPAGTVNPNSVRIIFRFTGDTWIQVKERGGSSLINRVMKEGEIYAVPDRPNLTLNTGNAGGMQILVDGTILPSLGETSVVRKDIPLDPDRLKNGLLVPVATSR